MAIKDEKAVVEIILKGQQANATIKEIEKSARALRAQLNRLPADSQEFADKSQELKKVNTRLASIREDIKGTGGMFQWLGKELKAFGIIAIAALGFQWFTGQVSNIIKGNANLSDSLADISKTTGMTAAETRKLNTAFSQMDTRTTAKDLRGIAVAAGQLGIAKNDILKFTAATDKMAVSLSDEFQGGAEQVTKVMGGLRTIFTDIKSDKIDEDLLHIGNAVNYLASTGAATGPVLTDFANRIGSVANTLGFTSAQTLGLSATLEELKVGTEKGSTAIVKILLRMTTHIAEFAKVANVPVKDFAELVNTDLFGAFTKVIEGSQKSGTSATALGNILDGLGVDGAGASEVMTKLGTNMTLLKERVTGAGTALKSTDSIMAEFNLKNRTLGADLDKLGKNVNRIFTNSTFTAGLQGIVGWLAKVTDSTKAVSMAMRDERTELMTTEAEILTYNVGNENRTKLIKELQDKYPAYLKNINAETVSQEDLSKAIAKVNDNLVNRIIIQEQDEKIAEQAEKQAKAAIKSGEARVAILKNMASIYAQNQQNLYKGAKVDLKKDLAGLPMDVQASEMLLYENYTGAGLSRYNHDIISLRENMDKWKEAEIELSVQRHESFVLDKEKQRLLSALGITTAETAKVIKASNKDAFVDPEALKKAEADLKKHNEEIKKLHEQLQADLKRMQDENNLFGLKPEDKEIAEAIRKHKETLDRLLNDKEASDADYLIANTNFINELKVIDEKYYKQEQDELKTHLKAQQELLNNANENELQAIKDKYAKEIEYNKQHHLDTLELEGKQDKDIQDLLLKIAEEQQDPTKPEKKQNGAKNLEGEINQMISIANTAQQIRKVEGDAEVASAELKYQNDIEREKRLLDMKIITQKEYDSRITKIESARQNVVREQAQKQFTLEKKLATTTIILQGLIAGAKAIGSRGIVGAIPDLILIGAAVTSSLILANKQQLPAYAAGGYHKAEGFTDGPGIYDSASGQPFVAGEAGTEYIVSNDMLRNGWVARNVEIMEAARNNRAFANGGFSADGGNARLKNGVSGNSGSGDNVMQEVKNLLKYLANNGVTARLNYDTLIKDQKSIDDAKSAGQVG